MKFPITDTGSIYKLIRTGNTESYNSVPAYTNVDVTCSPTGADVMTGDGGVYSFQIFELFIWDTSIQINNGDKFVSQDNITYLITGSPNLYKKPLAAIRTTAKVVM